MLTAIAECSCTYRQDILCTTSMICGILKRDKEFIESFKAQLMMNKSISIVLSDIDGTQYSFYQSDLKVIQRDIVNKFAEKTGKTLLETVTKSYYRKLESIVRERYHEFLLQPIGTFLLQLKSTGDQFYKKFLNECGDEPFCRFILEDNDILHLTGLYAFFYNDDVYYIGKTDESYRKRVNDGYGRISPTSCFISGHGNPTNCRINSLVNASPDSVRFYTHPMTDNKEIEKAEISLVRNYKRQNKLPYNKQYEYLRNPIFQQKSNK